MPYCHLERNVLSAGMHILATARWMKPSFLHETAEKEIAERYQVNHLGKGAWCTVLEMTSGKEDLAVAFYYDHTPYSPKESYYLHRILSILFPEHFPYLRAVWVCDEIKNGDRPLSVNIREEVKEVSSEHNWSAELIQEINRLEIPLEEGLDRSRMNWLTTKKGNTYYVDIAGPDGELDPKLIKTYMMEKKYREQEIHTVLSCIERLDALRQIS